MIELTSTDFYPLDGFPLLWRWADPQRDPLPVRALMHIHPLREIKASELWQYINDRYTDELWQYVFKNVPEPLPSNSLFAFILHIDANEDSMDNIAKKLRSLDLQDNEVIIVQWEQKLAITVLWETLREHWYHFCYPSSDDVYIYPLSELWFLLYHHEDQIVFGRPHQPLLQGVSRKRPALPVKPLIHREEVLRLIRANEKIAAIKLYHQETGKTLKEAMDAVNKLATELQQSADDIIGIKLNNSTMTYAIGDLHGEVTLLRRLLTILPFREEDTLVFLGDCLDRGEDSVATILALRELQRTHPACIFLRGNHEDAWLACWNGAGFSHVPAICGRGLVGGDTHRVRG